MDSESIVQSRILDQNSSDRRAKRHRDVMINYQTIIEVRWIALFAVSPFRRTALPLIQRQLRLSRTQPGYDNAIFHLKLPPLLLFLIRHIKISGSNDGPVRNISGSWKLSSCLARSGRGCRCMLGPVPARKLAVMPRSSSWSSRRSPRLSNSSLTLLTWTT